MEVGKDHMGYHFVMQCHATTLYHHLYCGITRTIIHAARALVQLPLGS